MHGFITFSQWTFPWLYPDRKDLELDLIVVFSMLLYHIFPADFLRASSWQKRSWTPRNRICLHQQAFTTLRSMLVSLLSKTDKNFGEKKVHDILLLQYFQMRAHIYQARSLIGSDASGLSDPFARWARRILTTMEHWDNFETIFGQLRDNFGITLRHLWNSFGITLSQLWNNSETTLG